MRVRVSQADEELCDDAKQKPTVPLVAITILNELTTCQYIAPRCRSILGPISRVRWLDALVTSTVGPHSPKALASHGLIGDSTGNR